MIVGDEWNCMKINLQQKSLYQQHQEMTSYILISITKDFSLDIFTQNAFFLVVYSNNILADPPEAAVVVLALLRFLCCSERPLLFPKLCCCWLSACCSAFSLQYSIPPHQLQPLLAAVAADTIDLPSTAVVFPL